MLKINQMLGLTSRSTCIDTSFFILRGRGLIHIYNDAVGIIRHSGRGFMTSWAIPGPMKRRSFSVEMLMREMKHAICNLHDFGFAAAGAARHHIKVRLGTHKTQV